MKLLARRFHADLLQCSPSISQLRLQAYIASRGIALFSRFYAFLKLFYYIFINNVTTPFSRNTLLKLTLTLLTLLSCTYLDDNTIYQTKGKHGFVRTRHVHLFMYSRHTHSTTITNVKYSWVAKQLLDICLLYVEHNWCTTANNCCLHFIFIQCSI